MEKKDKGQLPLDVVSAFEQLSGAVESTAMVEAAYFRALIKEGAPEDLAKELVHDWHNLYWQKQFYPEDEEF